MRLLWLTTALVVSVGVMERPSEASMLLVQEVLTQAKEGPEGAPAYVELFAVEQDDPFDLVVVDSNEWGEHFVRSVVTVTPLENQNVYIVHEGEWVGHSPLEQVRVPTDDLRLTSLYETSLTLALFDHVTGLLVDHRMPADKRDAWVDAVTYTTGDDVGVAEPWDQQVVRMDDGDALYRVLREQGEMLTGPVDEQLRFSQDLALSPGQMNLASLPDDDVAHMPEPGSAALVALLTAAVAMRRAVRN